MTDSECTNEDVLDAVWLAVTEVTPADHASASLPEVVAAGQARRRRRGRYRLAAGGVACAGLALGAVQVGIVAQPGAGTKVSVAAPGVGKASTGTSVSLEAWSVRANSDGTVTLDMRSFTELGQLRRVLAAHGLPVLLIRTRGQCSAEMAPDHNEMLNAHPGSVPTPSQPVALPGGHGLDWKIEVDPTEMPKGYELFLASGLTDPPRLSRPTQISEVGIVKIGNYPDCR